MFVCISFSEKEGRETTLSRKLKFTSFCRGMKIVVSNTETCHVKCSGITDLAVKLGTDLGFRRRNLQSGNDGFFHPNFPLQDICFL